MVDKNKFDRFLELAKLLTPAEGDNLYLTHDFGTFRYSSIREKYPTIDQAALLIVAQGIKYGYVGDKKFEYKAGTYQLMFFPMPIQMQIVDAN